ncbi:hypothetical protein THIOKS1860026 [Thiocapsa sp. KS1]|nr:hypothetical protein THIOKS1860026 [Thiocapsa sp. KS1]
MPNDAQVLAQLGSGLGGAQRRTRFLRERRIIVHPATNEPEGSCRLRGRLWRCITSSAGPDQCLVTARRQSETVKHRMHLYGILRIPPSGHRRWHVREASNADRTTGRSDRAAS